MRTIRFLAAELGEDEERLHEISEGTETEDGVILIYDLEERQILAFTNFGVESLVDLITEQRTTSS